jgi:hypothetical protein
VAVRAHANEVARRLTSRDQRSRGELLRATLLTGSAVLLGTGAIWIGVAQALGRRWPWQQFGGAASQTDVLKVALAGAARRRGRRGTGAELSAAAAPRARRNRPP